MSNQFQLAGAQETKPVHFAPIFTNRFFQGLWTQRNPLRDAGSTRIEEKFYGSRGDAMIAGSNVEISNRLTPTRRPGCSIYNSATYTAVDYFYEFRLFSANIEQIYVMVDTATALYNGTGPSGQALVWTKSAGAGQTFMQYVANILYFSNGVDAKKWVQTLTVWTASTTYPINNLQTYFIDPAGNIEQLIGTVQTTITNVAITSNVLTLTVGTSTGITNGDSYPLWGLTTATFLNGSTITVTSTTGGAGGTVVAPFTHANYVSAADTGVIAMLQGGTPETGATEPSWNASSTAPNNITIDNTAIWANRGVTIENWGIVGPSTAVTASPPTVDINVGTSGWAANTFYSNTHVIIDANGGIQRITTPGVSGPGTPAWQAANAGLNTTTTDGTVVWTKIQTALSTSWSAHTAYTAGQFLVESAGGTNCLFELVAGTSVATFPSQITSYYFAHNHSFSGQCDLVYPTLISSALATYTTPVGEGSILFNWSNPPSDPQANPMILVLLNGAGEPITPPIPNPPSNPPPAFLFPWTGATSNYTQAVLANIAFPVGGQYSITIYHDDGMFWAMGPGVVSNQQPQLISGPINNPAPATKTAVQGYAFTGLNPTGANNNSGNFIDIFTVNIPAADTYPIEIDYCQFINQQELILYVNGVTPVPTPLESATVEPVWPAWTTNFAPAYPTITESQGQYVWTNIGPAADYNWKAKTNYITTSTITDINNNTEDPYRAGVTGTVAPASWATGVNQLTLDAPNLTWINQGPAGAAPSGTVSTFVGGWSYCLALVNTLTNTVSNAGLVTVATGNFTGSPGVLISGGLPANIDPQVDYVAIFRTDDGGSTYFLVPGSQNSIYTTTLAQYQANGFVDLTPDTNLNILIEAPLAQQNTPPPTGFINATYHLGRIFGSVGNTVYWSIGPDTVVGNGNEGFPPLNTAVFPSLVKRIVPTSLGALIFTVSDIYLISGQGTSSSPLFPYPYAAGIGLLSYNALAVNGTTIYLFTADSQLISLDPSSGLSQIGFPIGDQFTLSNWNPATAYVAWHVAGSQDIALYVSDGATGWFRMTPTAAPESGLTWSPFATIIGGVKAVQSVEVLPGLHKLLLGPVTSGMILKRDLSVYQDNGNSYTANFTIGSIVLAQPGQVAELAFITTDSNAIGSKPSLAVLIDEIGGTPEALPRFTQDPPQLVPSSTVYSQRFYFSQSQSPALCRHLQIEVVWPAENAGNELLAMTIFGAYMQED
jgi:hypothetical protein